MKKYFLYEFKKNLLPLAVITIFAWAVYVMSIIPAQFVSRPINYPPQPYNCLAWIPQTILMILCTLVPMLMFSFKMKPRQVNLFYSLPIRREKIYLVHALVGLILVLIPYTFSYWFGFIITAGKEHLFELVYFVPLYFASIPLAVLLFGLNAFFFTQANKLVDGILFVGFSACAGALLVGYLSKVGVAQYNSTDFSFWFTYSPLTWLTTKYSERILSNAHAYSVPDTYLLEPVLWILAAFLGAAAWGGLFVTAKIEKAENAGQVSESWFGYRAMLPFYLALSIAIISLDISFAVLIVVFTAWITGMYFLFRRSFYLKKADLISMGVAFVLGIMLMTF